jgi:hypothetical protein
MIFPPAIVLISFFIYFVFLQKRWIQFVGCSFVLFLFLITIQSNSFVWNPHQIPNVQLEETVNFIQLNTNSQDYLLMWGAESGVNFLSKRPAPSRYVYQYPLNLDGFTTYEMVTQFENDLKEKVPIIIIDTLNPKLPKIPDCGENYRIEGSKNLTGFYKFFCSNYYYVGKIGPLQWKVYLKNGKNLIQGIGND